MRMLVQVELGARVVLLRLVPDDVTAVVLLSVVGGNGVEPRRIQIDAGRLGHNLVAGLEQLRRTRHFRVGGHIRPFDAVGMASAFAILTFRVGSVRPHFAIPPSGGKSRCQGRIEGDRQRNGPRVPISSRTF